MGETRPEHTQTLDTARRIVADGYGPSVELVLAEVIEDDPGYRNTFLRCRVDHGGEDAPASVIVKRANPSGGQALTEWAGLAFLGSTLTGRRIVPELYGADADAELLVMEDLGTGPRLRELLGGNDAHAARQGLVQLCECLGRIHAATYGQEEAFDVIRTRIGTRPAKGHVANTWDVGLQGFRERIESVGVDPANGFDAEIERAVSDVLGEGPFRTFTFGDVAPSNALVGPDGLRLYDTEFSGFRHCLVDGCYPQMRHLRANDARRLPRDLRDEMASVYRAELVRGCPVAADDEAYFDGLALCSAGWLAALCADLPRWMNEDQMVFLSTRRQRIVAALEEFDDLPGVDRFAPAMADTARRLRTRLTKAWAQDTEPMPGFPAFE